MTRKADTNTVRDIAKRPTSTASHWTREDATRIRPTAANTFPPFDTGKIKALMPGYHVWDNWFVLDEEGNIADIYGYTVLFALVRPIDDEKSAHAKIGYFYSVDGVHYIPGGFVFRENLFSDVQEWSGSTILRNDGRLQTFYTVAMGVELYSGWQTNQRFATAIQTISVTKKGLSLADPMYHALLAEPDGLYYQNIWESDAGEARAPTKHAVAIGDDQSNNLCFRDPSFFKDPKTGKTFLLFEANTGSLLDPEGAVKQKYIGSEDFDVEYVPTPDDLKANGCIGIAEFTNDEYTFVNLMPPVLTTNLVTDEVERIKMMVYDNHYYLFCVCHGNKMTIPDEDIINRDLLLGFRSEEMLGQYKPLNDTGVVIQQKSLGNRYEGQEKNGQYIYSWLVLPDLSVVSYANFSTDENWSLQPIKTAGPTVQIKIDGLKTRITDLYYNILPATVVEPPLVFPTIA